jgi:hypothetical protein
MMLLVVFKVGIVCKQHGFNQIQADTRLCSTLYSKVLIVRDIAVRGRGESIPPCINQARPTTQPNFYFRISKKWALGLRLLT